MLTFDKGTQNKSNNLKDKTETKRRRRKITWFKPPFNSNVSTNVGRTFFALIDKHFRGITSTARSLMRTLLKSATVACQTSNKQ